MSNSCQVRYWEAKQHPKFRHIYFWNNTKKSKQNKEHHGLLQAHTTLCESNLTTVKHSAENQEDTLHSQMLACFQEASPASPIVGLYRQTQFQNQIPLVIIISLWLPLQQWMRVTTVSKGLTSHSIYRCQPVL